MREIFSLFDEFFLTSCGSDEQPRFFVLERQPGELLRVFRDPLVRFLIDLFFLPENGLIVRLF